MSGMKDTTDTKINNILMMDTEYEVVENVGKGNNKRSPDKLMRKKKGPLFVIENIKKKIEDAGAAGGIELADINMHLNGN